VLEPPVPLVPAPPAPVELLVPAPPSSAPELPLFDPQPIASSKTIVSSTAFELDDRFMIGVSKLDTLPRSKPNVYFRPSLHVMSTAFAEQRPAPNPVQIEPAHMHVRMSVGQGLLLHSCRAVELGRPEANVTQIWPTAQSLLATQVGAFATTLLH